MWAGGEDQILQNLVHWGRPWLWPRDSQAFPERKEGVLKAGGRERQLRNNHSFVILYYFFYSPFNNWWICNNITLIPDTGNFVSSLCPWSILTRGLSILLSFSKNQILFPLISSLFFCFLGYWFLLWSLLVPVFCLFLGFICSFLVS